MKYLVTGSHGYIGENLVNFLESKGEVVGYDIEDPLGPRDILDYSLLKDEMRGVDICFHLAAISGIKACRENPTLALKTNVEGTLNVLRAAGAHGSKVAFSSSFACQDPTNLYAHMKSFAEKLVLHYEQYVCRFSNVYGGSNYLEKKSTVVSKFAQQDTMTVHGNGSQKRDFIHVEDVVRNIYRIADEYEPGPGRTGMTYAFPFNVNSGILTDVYTLAKMMQSIKGGRMIYTEDDPGISSEYVRPTFPAQISLEEGLKKLIQG